MNLCDECGTFISHSIAENFNNNFLDVKKVTAEAAGKYGFERAMLMLALRVDSLNYDGVSPPITRNGRRNSLLTIPMPRKSGKQRCCRRCTDIIKTLDLVSLFSERKTMPRKNPERSVVLPQEMAEALDNYSAKKCYRPLTARQPSGRNNQILPTHIACHF
mgnify:CR=1 FL=1